LKEIRPDLIHSQGFGFLFFDIAMWRYKRFVNKQVKNISTPHGPFMSKPEKGIRAIVKAAFSFMQKIYLNSILDMVIAENPEQPKWIQKTYGIKEKKIHLLTPIMPQPKLSLKKLRDIKLKKRYLQITSLSRLADYKGFDDIVAAFNEISTAGITKLVIAGKTDNFHKQIAEIIAASPRKEDIRLEKDITEKQKQEILQQTDIFVFASQWEAFGIVIAEAMANACAIISTDTEGGKFLVSPGKNGYLFEYKNTRQLVDHVNKLINDSKLLEEMQRNSYKLVGNYTEEIIFQKYKKLITKTINNG
jgi:glycosyltransferase involved in cell wall biosynthesis